MSSIDHGMVGADKLPQTPLTIQFRELVLHHIHQHLISQEWERFRRRAKDDVHAMLSPESAFDEYICEADLSPDDILTPRFQPYVQIGEIMGKPVWYVEKRGIYLWGESREKRGILMFWCTSPEYPPGW